MKFLPLIAAVILLVAVGMGQAHSSIGNLTFVETVAATKCESDYTELKNAMLRVYGRVLYVNPEGLAHLNVLFKDGEWGEVDHFIIGTHEATRTMDVLLFKCSKLIKSFIQMSAEDFNRAQTIWKIYRYEMLTWGRPI